MATQDLCIKLKDTSASTPKLAKHEELSTRDQAANGVVGLKPALDANVSREQSACKAEVQNVLEAVIEPQPQGAGHAEVLARDVFAAWYSSVYTTVFADKLSALHKSQDNSHTQPSLILKCVKMHAESFEPQHQEVVVQKVALPQKLGNYCVSCWL